MKKTIWILIISIISYLLNSCSMERQLAMEFVEKQGKGTPVMLMPPALLYMFNNKPIKTLSYSKSLNIDSLSFYQSEFLQYLSDSVFLENYMDAFITTSENYGFRIFLPYELDEFIRQEKVSYIVRIAQMELVEDTISWEVEEQINFRKTISIVPIDKIALSTWFEISQKDSASYYTYFNEESISDETYGDFRQELWSMDIKYDYTVFKIELEDIYRFANDLGSLHASFFYDLILNTYIWNRLAEDRKQHYVFLHYNHDYHLVETADESFIRLDDE